MSDNDPNLETAKLEDDDTSAGSVTQGGRGDRKGHSIWWVAAVIIIVVVAGAIWVSTRKSSPAEHGTIPVAGTATNPS